MKVSSGLCVLFLVLGTAFLFLNFSNGIITEMVFPLHGGYTLPMITASRRLKENGYINRRRSEKNGQRGDVNLEDYHPIDPVPSSKASFKPGPIEDGTPLMPYIPRPTPPAAPAPPENGGFA